MARDVRAIVNNKKRLAYSLAQTIKIIPITLINLVDLISIAFLKESNVGPMYEGFPKVILPKP